MTILKGKKVVKGQTTGEALVSPNDFSFSGIDPLTGIVREKGHAIEGQCIAGKILVFPTGTGSTGGSYILYGISKKGLAPRAIIVAKADEVTAVGAIMGNIPMVHGFKKNPTDIIKTGDRLKVNADQGIVEVLH